VVICGTTSSVARARRPAGAIRMGRAERRDPTIWFTAMALWFPEHSPRAGLRKWGFPLALLTYRVKK
jgi:hypothetical protein